MPAGMTNVGLGLEFSARDLASGPISLLSRHFSQLEGAVTGGVPRITAGFSLLAAGVATMGAGLAGIHRAWGAAVSAGDFEREMAAVGVVTRGTTAEINDLRDAAIQAGIATQYSPLEAAQGLRTLAQQGLIARDAIRGLGPVLNFAAAGNLSVAEAAEVAVGTMNAYGMTVDHLSDITDKLMRGTQISALSANEFATVMGRAASSGKIFGTGLDDVIIALGSVRSAGIPASVATTALSEAMRRLTTDQAAVNHLQELGIRVADQHTGRLRSILDITRDMQQATRGMNEQERARLVSLVFGVRGMRAFNAIANVQARVVRNGATVTLHGAEAIRHYREELASAAGTTDTFRERTLGTFAGQMVLLQGTLQTLSTVFGRVFGSLFRPLVLGVTNGLNLLIRAWNSLSEQTRQFISGGFIVGSVLAVIVGGIMTLAGGITLAVTLLGGLLTTVGTVMAGVAAAMVPVIALFAGLAAGAATLYEVWQQDLGGVRAIVSTVFGDISLAFRSILAVFSGAAFPTELFDQGHSRMRVFVAGLLSIWEHVQAFAAGFRSTFSEIWTSLGPVFAELFAAFQDLTTVIGGALTEIVGAGAAVPTESFRSFGQVLATVVGTGLRWFVQNLTFAIRVGMGVYRVIHAIGTVFSWVGRLALIVMHPFIQLLHVVLWAMGKIFRAIVAVYGFLSRHHLLFGAIGYALHALGGGASAAPSQAEGQGATEALTRAQHTRGGEVAAPTPTSHPAIAQATNAAALAMPAPARPAEMHVQNDVRLTVDGRQLAEVVQRIQADQHGAHGEVVSDSSGAPVSALE